VAPKDFGEKGKGDSAAKRGAVDKGDDAPFRGYINLNLTAEEKLAFAGWYTADVALSVLGVQVAGGVNVAVKPDPKGEGFLASATQRRRSSVNAGLCVTARAGSPELSLGRLTYILAILERSESWEETQPIADPDRW